MQQSNNWQNQIKLTGHHCYVAIRHLSDAPAWGRIGNTQVTYNGICPPRVVFAKRRRPNTPDNHLLKLSVLKRSMTGTLLVPNRFTAGEIKLTAHQYELKQHEFRTKIYGLLQRCADMDAKLWGGDIILGINHEFYSALDQPDAAERNGNYKSQKPIPDPFMINGYGNLVPWVAPPLSDNRSLGDWEVKYGRFYVQDEMDPEIGPIPAEITIRRVGQYHFV